MPEPVRHHPLDPRAAPQDGDSGVARSSRPLDEDPLEELARILGETGGYPARPETTVEVGRRATPSKPAPQQLSALEAELFEELRSSVAPEDRVRGNFKREVPPVIPQRPVDDRDIASLSLGSGGNEDLHAASTSATTPVQERQPETPWADYYSYDEGVAAGSYDPAFAGMPNMAQEQVQWAPQTGRGSPRPTFDEFGTAEIATAAQETSPYVAAEPMIRPHSRSEEQAATRLAHDRPRSVVTTVAVMLGVILAGGGAYAGWKAFGDRIVGGPIRIVADGKPLKVLPDPTKAPVADAEPSLKPDSGSGASKIVSLQEDPVEQVSGRTPEGKEVRVINPGAQRPASDQPHTVKTVIVRPDGSIVSDGAAAKVQSVTPIRISPDAPPQAQPQLPLPGAITATGGATTPTLPASPQVTLPPPPPPFSATPEPVAGRPVQTPLPVAAPARPQAPAPVATTPVAPAPTAPAPTAVAPKLLAQTKPAVPAPVQTKPATPNAPMALGPGAPKVASQAPAPVAPVAAVPAAASGEWMVQISASKSDADARRSFAEQSRKYPALSGRSLDVQTANLGDKGTFYRARVPAGTREQAAALCSQLQAQGGQCMVVKR